MRQIQDLAPVFQRGIRDSNRAVDWLNIIQQCKHKRVTERFTEKMAYRHRANSDGNGFQVCLEFAKDSGGCVHLPDGVGEYDVVLVQVTGFVAAKAEYLSVMYRWGEMQYLLCSVRGCVVFPTCTSTPLSVSATICRRSFLAHPPHWMRKFGTSSKLSDIVMIT